MKTALEVAGIKQYVPTMHVINRARTRFGIKADHVAEWINDLMDRATYVAPSTDRTSVYVADDIRLIIDDMKNAVVTIHPEVKTDFLRPALEREKRKLDRLYTRSIRKIELIYAETLRELAEMAINRARARNPQTRALIAERMSDKESEIEALVSQIEHKNDEWQAKVRAIELIAE